MYNIVTVADGLTLNGTATDDFADLQFSNTQTLGGTGTIELVYGGDIGIAAHPVLTIAPGIQILGNGNEAEIIGNNMINEGNIEVDGNQTYLEIELNSIQNEGSLSVGDGAAMFVSGLVGDIGSISLMGAASSVYIEGTSYTVDSSFNVSDGQTLALLGTWTLGQADTVSVDGGTLGLGSTFSLQGISVTDSKVEVLGNSTFSQFEPFLAEGNQLVVGTGGVLDNTGSTISLDSSTGDLTLAGGTRCREGRLPVQTARRSWSSIFNTLEGVILREQFQRDQLCYSRQRHRRDRGFRCARCRRRRHGSMARPPFRSSSGIVEDGSIRFRGIRRSAERASVLLVGGSRD